jgi:hypothetical protein
LSVPIKQFTLNCSDITVLFHIALATTAALIKLLDEVFNDRLIKARMIITQQGIPLM